MTTDLHALARQVVQSPHWQWMPGMVSVAGTAAESPLRVLVIDSYGVPVEWAIVPTGKANHVVDSGYGSPGWCADVWLGDALPDLSDPATLGCLLALVREAWGDATIHVVPSGRYCFVRGMDGHDLRWAHPVCINEPAALVAAILAAPPPTRAGQ